jgi:ribosomal protein L11 methylase PrmA
VDWIEHYFELAVVGVVSSLFTTFLARKSFISERWWDRKADAYARILEALVEMERYHEAYWNDLAQQAELSDERKAELRSIWKTAWREVDNAIRLGAFVISQEAHAALAKLQAATRGLDPQDFFGRVDAQFAATTECIKQMREIGRRDLQVDARWSLWSRLAWLAGSLRRNKAPEAANP